MKVYESHKGSVHYLKLKTNFELNDNQSEKIIVDTAKTYQEFYGFGGAFTESTCYLLSKMKKIDREKVLKDYFVDNKYNFCRLTIHSSDFAMSNYEYVRDFRDTQLNTFNIENDKIYILPILKEALEINPDIRFFSSPWSPPAFMKTNNLMNRGGKLRKEYRQMYADYIVRYIKAYKEEGINIWAVTIQNEPSAIQTWESCFYSAEEEADFAKNYLIPAIEEGNLDTKIIMHDHNRDDVVTRMEVAFKDEELRNKVHGVGIHWYMVDEFENISKLKEMYPEKHIYFTEGCCPYNETEGGFSTGVWQNGEKYAFEIINNLNNYVEAFCDWNMVLDHRGGPNHVENYCDAPIMLYEDLSLRYNNSFYYISHFAKFIEHNSIRVKSKALNNKLSVLAMKNTDNTVVVVLNKNEYEVEYELFVDGKQKYIYIPPRGIQTIVI